MTDHFKMTVTSEPAADQCMRDLRQMVESYGYVTVEVKAGKRSKSQNDLYWEWLSDLSDYINSKKGTDVSKDDMHDYMRHKYLGYDQPKKIGSVEVRERLKTTTQLTTGEMFHYMSEIDAYAASIGLMLPRPDDCQYERNRRKQDG